MSDVDPLGEAHDYYERRMSKAAGTAALLPGLASILIVLSGLYWLAWR